MHLVLIGAGVFVASPSRSFPLPFRYSLHESAPHGHAPVNLNRSMDTALEIGSIAEHLAVGALLAVPKIYLRFETRTQESTLRSSEGRARERYAARSINTVFSRRRILTGISIDRQF